MAVKKKSGLKGIWQALKSNPAVLIVLGVIVIVVIYLIANQANQNNPNSTAAQNAQGNLSSGSGYYLLTTEDSGAGWQSAYNALASSLHTHKSHVSVHHDHDKHSRHKQATHQHGTHTSNHHGSNPNIHTTHHVPANSGSRTTHIFHRTGPNKSGHHQNPNKLPEHHPHVAAPHGPPTNVHGNHHAPGTRVTHPSHPTNPSSRHLTSHGIAVTHSSHGSTGSNAKSGSSISYRSFNSKGQLTGPVHHAKVK